MSKILNYAVVVALLFVGLGAFAQDKTQAYYNAHESEILPDAQAAFRDGDYDRAAELCKWHYIIVGDNRADELRDKAEQCLKLTVEMNVNLSTGQKKAARETALAILSLNPDDKKAQEVSKYEPTPSIINNTEWVDLGLPSGLKWSTCNLGASKPEEFGEMFAWGETQKKDTYDWTNYRWCRIVNNEGRSQVVLTKYTRKNKNGPVDNKTRLDPSDDAATAILGSGWRTPTMDDWEELITSCKWEFVSRHNILCYKGTSYKNGKTIFFPLGYSPSGGIDPESGFFLAQFWTSQLEKNPEERSGITLGPDDAYPVRVDMINDHRKGKDQFYIGKGKKKIRARYEPLSIRPVKD